MGRAPSSLHDVAVRIGFTACFNVGSNFLVCYARFGVKLGVKKVRPNNHWLATLFGFFCVCSGAEKSSLCSGSTIPRLLAA